MNRQITPVKISGRGPGQGQARESTRANEIARRATEDMEHDNEFPKAFRPSPRIGGVDMNVLKQLKQKKHSSWFEKTNVSMGNT